MRRGVLILLAAAIACATPAKAAGKQARPDTRTTEQLLDAMAAELPNDRFDAAKALAAKGTDAVPLFIKALGSKDANVRRAATDGLAELKTDAKPALEPLIKALKDENAWVRDGAAGALGGIGSDAGPATKALLAATKDSDMWVRGSAIKALTSITKDTSILLPGATSVMSFDDSGWSAKRFAIGVLSKHGKAYKPAIPALLRNLRNPGEGMWVSTNAVVDLLIGMGEVKQVLPVLVKMLKSKNRGVPNKAAAMLGKMGEQARPAVPTLKTVQAETKEKSVREAIKKALEQIEKK